MFYMHCSGLEISTSRSDNASDKALCGKHFVVCCQEKGDKGKCVNTAQFNNYFCFQVDDSLAVSAYCILPISGVERMQLKFGVGKQKTDDYFFKKLITNRVLPSCILIFLKVWLGGKE